MSNGALPPQFYPLVELLNGNYVITQPWADWTIAMQAVAARNAAGVSGTIPLAKITGGGTDGSLTFVSGILTAFVAPT